MRGSYRALQTRLDSTLQHANGFGENGGFNVAPQTNPNISVAGAFVFTSDRSGNRSGVGRVRHFTFQAFHLHSITPDSHTTVFHITDKLSFPLVHPHYHTAYLITPSTQPCQRSQHPLTHQQRPAAVPTGHCSGSSSVLAASCSSKYSLSSPSFVGRTFTAKHGGDAFDNAVLSSLTDQRSSGRTRYRLHQRPQHSTYGRRFRDQTDKSLSNTLSLQRPQTEKS
jgi:hypothetical protein